MWLIFGIVAIIAAGLNIWCWCSKKKPEVFRFLSLAFTALTVCDFYMQSKEWVLAEDWGALADVVPTTSSMLCVAVLLAIVINGVTLLKK